jgi:hypothetical protein
VVKVKNYWGNDLPSECALGFSDTSKESTEDGLPSMCVFPDRVQVKDMTNAFRLGTHTVARDMMRNNDTDIQTDYINGRGTNARVHIIGRLFDCYQDGGSVGNTSSLKNLKYRGKDVKQPDVTIYSNTITVNLHANSHRRK